MLCSGKLRAFGGKGFTAGKDSALHFSASELKAFLKIFGLYGTLAMWNELEADQRVPVFDPRSSPVTRPSSRR